MLKLLNNPQNKFKSIHITGTNGKTSTTYMIDNILHAHGFKTGKFTSPHLKNVLERIQIDGEPITNQQLIEVYQIVMPKIEYFENFHPELGKLSFFEIMTVLAFQIFYLEDVDYAVVEVGLGGRFDATNVLSNKVVAVITPIGLDHMDYLGNTLEAITVEKAGIICPNIPVVVAQQVESVWKILERKVDSQQIVKVISEDSTDSNYLQQNARVAITVVQTLAQNWSILFNYGLAEQIALQTDVPGRLQQLSEYPIVIVDVAHNSHGASALVQALLKQFTRKVEHRKVAVVAMFSDKDSDQFLQVLSTYFTNVVVTGNSSERTRSAVELAELASTHFDAENILTASTVCQATELASEIAGENGLVVITGSVVTVADYLQASHHQISTRSCGSR